MKFRVFHTHANSRDYIIPLLLAGCEQLFPSDEGTSILYCNDMDDEKIKSILAEMQSSGEYGIYAFTNLGSVDGRLPKVGQEK